ncbi:MAG: hypothetical protein KDB21_15940 [Acidimicrobiales bacterium]|nr:hypothetical protein [Acidimicrobiales bacterium]
MNLDEQLRAHLQAHRDLVSDAGDRLSTEAVVLRARRAARRRRIVAAGSLMLLLVVAVVGGWALSRSGHSDEPTIITGATPSAGPSPSPTADPTPAPTASPEPQATDQLRPLVSAEWEPHDELASADVRALVSWDGGLLRVDSSISDGVLRLSESGDGLAWTDRDPLPLPDGTTWVFTAEAYDDRLYVLLAAEPSRRIAVTTDLSTWDAVVDLPPPTDLGWPETAPILPELTDLAVNGETIVVVGHVVAGFTGTDDMLSRPAGSSPQAIAWNGSIQAGFDADALVRGGFGPQVASTGDGFALITPGPGGIVGLASPDGREWSPITLPDQPFQPFAVGDGPRGAIVLMSHMGGLAGLVIDDAGVVTSADTSELTWLSDERYHDTVAVTRGGEDGLAVLLFAQDRVEPQASPPVVIEANGYELTVDMDAFPSFELRRADTGELVTDDPAALSIAADGSSEYRDPSTGELLLTVTAAEFDAALTESLSTPGSYDPPTERDVVFTDDGLTWHWLSQDDVGDRLPPLIGPAPPFVELVGTTPNGVYVRIGDRGAVLPTG